MLKYLVCFMSCWLVVGCDLAVKTPGISRHDNSSPEVKEFIEEVKRNLVFVEGGEFLMGDYGAEYGPERLPYDPDKDSKPVHRVELDNYSIDRFKVTNEGFRLYLKNNGLQLRVLDGGRQSEWEAMSAVDNIPAYLDWFEADNYCAWLAKVTDLPFALPSEAQWEYAARSRGQFLFVATNDGTYKISQHPITEFDGPRGINISTDWDRIAFAKEMGWDSGSFTPLPVDRFPPNPLGLYAMSDNGLEWVSDWYDPTYYQRSPVKNPTGPVEPIYKSRETNNNYAKVIRGKMFADPRWGGGVNVHRNFRAPDAYIPGFGKDADSLFSRGMTARCVVNSPTSVN
jgi:formylglycine-generating enzyme required for sulfatase activity